MNDKYIIIKRKVTGLKLKIVACITMCIDHIGAVILEKYIPISKSIETLNIAFRLIGRMSFPIYCFLLVEGFKYTSNKQKYIFRIALFALVSEIPYDLAFYGRVIDWTGQNVFFTLGLGLLTLYILEAITHSNISSLIRLICCSFTILFAGVLNALLLHGSYGFFGICTIAAAYLIRKKEDAYMAECAILLLMSYSEATSLLALPLIHIYNGERGKSLKWTFYIFYPAHLLILTIISHQLV